ncbi:MAG: hypothetical protein JWO68_3212 [Actinomycetia bacterium]|nr:hypothetical protein [Actinomycetes bacterium]
MARRLLVLFVPLLLLAGACSDDKKAADVTTTSSTSTTVPGSTTTEAPSTTQPAPTVTTTPPGSGIAMTGPVGSGSVAYSLDAGRNELCYRITVKGVGAPTAAHLHRATGEEVVALQAPPADGTVNNCAASDAITIQEIESNPTDFVIDVHAAKGLLKATLR